MIDPEGRVSETLGCGGDWIWRGARRYQESKPGKGLGLLPEIAEEVAALKLLQPAPLCPALGVLIDRRIFVEESGQFFARPQGGSLKGCIGPTASEVGCMSINEGE